MDMRLIVAGAGGRMGRTLVRAIAEGKGVALAGALEEARSPLLGRDAGVLAGLPANGVALVADIGPPRARPARCPCSAPPAFPSRMRSRSRMPQNTP